MAAITVQFFPMKRRLLTFLALALLALPAASPYFLSGVPRTNDLPAHLFRTFFFDRAVQWGGLWPRWSPDLVYSYGYPVFNFFPSLFHWVVNLIHHAGLPLLTAYRVTVYLHFLAAALGSFRLGSTVLRSHHAGWAAALVYTYSPYLLYDAHVRGSGPETQALALLPWLILALWQVSDQPAGSLRQTFRAHLRTPYPVLLTAVFFAAAFLSHSSIIFQILIPVGLWLFIKALLAVRNGRFGATLIGPVMGIGLGGLLVAFYWLPAFAEVSFTQANNSISQGYTYQSHLLSLLDLLRWPHIPADPALVNPPVVRPLPVIGILWAAAGILWRWRQMPRHQREIVITWTAILLLCIWLITPGSQFVWGHSRLLQFTFYPWRLLSMVSLATAVLAAVTMANSGDWWLENKDFANLKSQVSSLSLPFLFTILIITTSIPWLYPPRYFVPENIDLALALSDEQPPNIIGTTTLGEFLPQWVTELPPSQPAKNALLDQDNPDRLQPVEGLAWTRRSTNPIDALYTVQAARPLTITYGQFYFPGWQVMLDGIKIPIIVSSPQGLITVELPTGEHELRFIYGRTWSHTLGTIISGLALLVWVGLAIYERKMKREERFYEPGTPRKTGNHPSSFSLHHFHILLLGITAVLVWLFFTFVETPLRRETLLPDGVAGKPAITPLDYAGELRLLTFEQSSITIASDAPLQLTLYWQPQRGIGVPYLVGVQAVDENGLQWSASVDRPADWRFIGQDPWPLDGYRLEPSVVRLLDGSPPGTYQFHVGLVRADTGQTIAAYNLGAFQVTKPAQGERPLEDGMNAAPETAVANRLRLLGSRLDRREAAPGDLVRVAGLWQVLDDGETAVSNQFTLQLITADGTPILSQSIIIAPDFPPSQWQPNDRLRSETVLRLPAATPDGDYTWQINWGEQQLAVGNLHVTAPNRLFTTPAPNVTFNESFADVAVLLGASIAAPPTQMLVPSGSFDVTLQWQSQRETSTSYRVFVHLINEQGEILAQSDGEPAAWTRPTTGWLPGEIVLDRHILTLPANLPPGPFSLRIGLYNAVTGQRLSTTKSDSVIWPITQ